MSNELTVPLTHIASVRHYCHSGYRVCAVYLRGSVPDDKVDGMFIFVPGTVKAGDDILPDPGVRSYANADWAEWYAAGATGPTPHGRQWLASQRR